MTQLVCNALLSLANKCQDELTAEDIRPVPSSVSGSDIWMSSAAAKRFPFSIECKNQETVSIWKWWAQCEGTALKEGREPLLIFCRNNARPKVVIDLDLFLRLASKIS